MSILERLKELLPPSAEGDTGATRERRLRVACAALMVEIQRADHEIREDEEAEVARLLAARFGLDDAETDELMTLAGERVDTATSLYEFTSVLHRGLSDEEKRELMAMLWRTAWADGSVQRDEEHMLRKVAELLYIPHSDFVRIKLEVEDERHGG